MCDDDVEKRTKNTTTNNNNNNNKKVTTLIPSTSSLPNSRPAVFMQQMMHPAEHDSGLQSHKPGRYDGENTRIRQIFE